MDAQPVDFLLAKQAVDYFVKANGLNLSEEHYKFHVYNLAQLMSVDHLTEDDDFVKDMVAFKSRYWSMMDEIHKDISRRHNNLKNTS